MRRAREDHAPSYDRQTENHYHLRDFNPHPSQIMRSRRKASKQRPYVVAELVCSFLYHGRLWTVGCMTEAAAEASFRRRVAKNLAETGSPGAVIAFRRQGRKPLCWTDEVLDAKTMLKHYGC